MLIRFSVCTGSLSSWRCITGYTHTHKQKHIDIKYIICQLNKITDSRSQMALIALPNIAIYIWVGKHVQDNGIPHVMAILSICRYLQIIFSVSCQPWIPSMLPSFDFPSHKINHSNECMMNHCFEPRLIRLGMGQSDWCKTGVSSKIWVVFCY